MALFTRILNLPKGFLVRLRNKRKHSRYRVGETFPLKAMLNLAGDDKVARDRPLGHGPGLDWGGRVGDLSANGLNIYLPPSAITTRGEPSIVCLTLENHKFSIPCTVAYHRIYPRHTLCGVKLLFKDFPVQKTYQQLVEAVSLGASFSPSARGAGGRTPAGFVRRSWRSTNKAILTEWRVVDHSHTDRFELSLGDHLVSGSSATPGLEVHARAPSAKTPTQSVSPEAEDEVRQLFRWVVPNLPESVPAELRTLMARVSLEPPPLAARIKASRTPPAKWAPPPRKT